MTSVKLKVQVWIYVRTVTQPSSNGNNEDSNRSHNMEYKFLILKTRPERGGFWQPITGSVEENESLEIAAKREATEESGLTFLTEVESLKSHFEFQSRGSRVQEHGFSLQASPNPQMPETNPEVKLDPHEHLEYRWASAKEAYDMIEYPSNKQMLNLLLKQLNILTSAFQSSLKTSK